MAFCNKEHRYDASWASLADSQEFFGEDERWKCAGCAYDQGVEHATNGNVRKPNLNILDQSQAGTVRHKDPVEAYNLGYDSI